MAGKKIIAARGMNDGAARRARRVEGALKCSGVVGAPVPFRSKVAHRQNVQLGGRDRQERTKKAGENAVGNGHVGQTFSAPAEFSVAPRGAS
jgi:hypothetical protein